MQATTPTTTTQSKPRIRVLGPARYLIESSSQPGVGHQVDVLHLRCGCKAGQYGRRCKHLTLAIQYDAWRQRQRDEAGRQRRATPASAPVVPVPELVRATPQVAAEARMRRLQEAFE